MPDAHAPSANPDTKPRIVHVVLLRNKLLIDVAAEHSIPGEVRLLVIRRGTTKPVLRRRVLPEHSGNLRFSLPLDRISQIGGLALASFSFDIYLKQANGAKRLAMPEHTARYTVEFSERTLRFHPTKGGNASIRSHRTLWRPKPRSLWPIRRQHRVMLLIRRLDAGGGMTRAVINIANAVASIGHDVCLTSIGNRNREAIAPLVTGVGFDFIDGEYKAHPADASTGLSTIANILSEATAMTDLRLARYLQESDFDLIYVPAYDGLLYRMLREHVPARTKLILGEHSGGRYQHAWTDKQQEEFLFAARQFDGIHVVNPLMLPTLARLTERLAFYIPNVLPEHVKRQMRIFDSRKIVVLDRLSPGKQVGQIIEAFGNLSAAHPEWSLHIYGRGEQYAALQKKIANSAANDRTHLHGFDSNAREQLNSAAIFATASRAEAFSLSAGEAMSAGCLIVSRGEHLSARHLLRDGENSILARHGGLESFRQALERAMRLVELRDPSVREMANQAQREVRQFSSKAVAKAWHKAFKKIL